MAKLTEALQAAGGPLVQTHGGPSVGLANGIRAGELAADLFASADAQVIETVLMGAANGDVARWQVIFCRQRMALVYSPNSRFKTELDAAAAGTVPWYVVVQQPGLVLKRGDPRNDPGGYRGVLAMRLAELHYSVPGLADRLLQGEDNEERMSFGGDFRTLQEGAVDASMTHATSATRLGLPFVALPDEVNQGNPALAAFYARVSYTNPLGQTFRGRPLAYGATVPSNATQPDEALIFLAYLVSPEGQVILARHGFEPTDALVGGDEGALPDALRELVRGRYDEAGSRPDLTGAVCCHARFAGSSMTDAPSTPSTAAGRRWQALAQVHQEQTQRLRDPAWEAGGDFRPSFVESFRAGRGRWDDAAVVDALRPHRRSEDTFVDVGAGAGRFAQPIARLVREVVAVEPFLRWMTAAARRWAGIVLFAEPPQSWLAPFWPLVHGEERVYGPHFPQLVDVLEDLGLGPIEVTQIDAEPFPLGSEQSALARLRRRLYVVPGSEADARLASAMRELLEKRDGTLAVRGVTGITLGLARWATT